MAVINTPIGLQKHDKIRNRLCSIILDELTNQADLLDNDKLICSVWGGRKIAFDKTELPAINVLFYEGLYSNKTQVKRDGEYTFLIDVYTSSGGQDGDVTALNLAQRISGIVASILEHPHYKTLGFCKPFTCTQIVDSIRMMDTSAYTLENISMYRIEFKITVQENVSTENYEVMKTHETTVKIHNTDKGFLYILE